MSDLIAKAKELKALIASLIAGVLVVIAIGGAIMDWRIGVHVARALGEQDLGTDAKIVSMDDEIDRNGAVGLANTARIEGNERRVELAFAALMGRPPPEEE